MNFLMFSIILLFSHPINICSNAIQCKINSIEEEIQTIKFNVTLSQHEIKTYHKYVKRYSKDRQLYNNYKKHYDDYKWIREQLNHHNLPPDLVYIIVVESTMNPKLKSGRYHGIWQMSKYHCKGDDINCLYSYRESTKYAIKYLLELKEIFNNNHRNMIYGYNCGYGRILSIMKKHNNQVPFNSLPHITKLYIPKMLAAKHVLENVFPAAEFEVNKDARR